MARDDDHVTPFSSSFFSLGESVLLVKRRYKVFGTKEWLTMSLYLLCLLVDGLSVCQSQVQGVWDQGVGRALDKVQHHSSQGGGQIKWMIDTHDQISEYTMAPYHSLEQY